MICARPHQLKDHQYSVSGYQKKLSKICVYVKIQYANCRSRHLADSSRFNQRYKVEIDVCKNKIIKKGKRKMAESINKQDKTYDKTNLAENIRTEEILILEKKEESLTINTEIELEVENYAKNSITKFSFNISD